MKLKLSKVIRVLFSIHIVIIFLSEFSLLPKLIYILKYITPGIIILLSFFVNKNSNENKFIAFWYLIYFLSVLISLLNIKSNFISLLHTVTYLQLFYLTLFVFPKIISHTKKEFKNYRNIYFVMMLFSVLFSVFIRKDFMNDWHVRPRYHFLFQNPNTLAFYALIGIFLSVITFEKKSLIKQLLMVTFFVFMIVLSDSRTSLYTFIFTMLSLNIISRVKKRHTLFNILIIFILITLISLPILINHVDINKLNLILTGRIDRVLLATSEFRTIDYVFGTSPGTRITDPHNYIVNTIIENGIVGLIIVLSLIFSSAIKLIIRFDNTSKTYLVIIVSFLIYNFAESTLVSMGNFNSIFFWILVGLSFNAKFNNSKEYYE